MSVARSARNALSNFTSGGSPNSSRSNTPVRNRSGGQPDAPVSGKIRRSKQKFYKPLFPKYKIDQAKRKKHLYEVEQDTHNTSGNKEEPVSFERDFHDFRKYLDAGDDDPKYVPGEVFPVKLCARPDFRTFMDSYEKGLQSSTFLNKIRAIFKKRERTDWDVKMLMKLCSNYTFFDQFEEEVTRKELLCRAFDYEVLLPGQVATTVSRPSESMEKMYLVISGRMLVESPNRSAMLLSAGSTVGESSLQGIKGEKRKRPMVTAQEETEVLTIHRKDYERALRTGLDDDEVLPMFANLDIFKGWSKNRLVEFVAFLRPVHLGDGEIVFDQGEVAEAMYFVISGEVRVEMRMSFQSERRVPTEMDYFEIVTQTKTRMIEVKRLKRGEYFGEDSIFRKTRRSARVTACGRAALLKLHAVNIDRLNLGDEGTIDRMKASAKEYTTLDELKRRAEVEASWKKYQTSFVDAVHSENNRPVPMTPTDTFVRPSVHPVKLPELPSTPATNKPRKKKPKVASRPSSRTTGTSFTTETESRPALSRRATRVMSRELEVGFLNSTSSIRHNYRIKHSHDKCFHDDHKDPFEKYRKRAPPRPHVPRARTASPFTAARDADDDSDGDRNDKEQRSASVLGGDKSMFGSVPFVLEDLSQKLTPNQTMEILAAAARKNSGSQESDRRLSVSSGVSRRLSMDFADSSRRLSVDFVDRSRRLSVESGQSTERMRRSSVNSESEAMQFEPDPALLGASANTALQSMPGSGSVGHSNAVTPVMTPAGSRRGSVIGALRRPTIHFQGLPSLASSRSGSSTPQEAASQLARLVSESTGNSPAPSPGRSPGRLSKVRQAENQPEKPITPIRKASVYFDDDAFDRSSSMSMAQLEQQLEELHADDSTLAELVEQSPTLLDLYGVTPATGSMLLPNA